MERTRTFRGISVRAARHYLAGLGGEVRNESTDVGDGWVARLDVETDPVGPSLRHTKVTVRVRGDPDVVPSVVEAFSKKAVRAGG